MSKKNNRICKVCQEAYYFCPSCGKASASEKYKTMFCSENCHNIFETLSRFVIGTINKYEAKEIFSSLDLSKQNQFTESIKIDIDTIMKTNKKNKKKEKIEDIIVIDNNQSDNIILDNINTQLVVEEQEQIVVDTIPEF